MGGAAATLRSSVDNLRQMSQHSAYPASSGGAAHDSGEFTRVKQHFLHASSMGASNRDIFNALTETSTSTSMPAPSRTSPLPGGSAASPGGAAAARQQQRISYPVHGPKAHGAAALAYAPLAPTAERDERTASGGSASAGATADGARRNRRAQIFQSGFDFSDAQRMGALQMEVDTSKDTFLPENRAIIQAAMARVFFSGADAAGGARLQGQAFDRLLGAFERRECAPGEWLMREGEVGEEMYVVADGALEAFVGGDKVRDVRRGDAAGELALLYGAPRSASVRAPPDAPAAAVLWSLRRDAFREVQAVTSGAAMSARLEALAAAPALEPVDVYALSLLAGLADGVALEAGATAAVEHEVITRCILVDSGQLEITSSTTSTQAELERLCGIHRPRSSSDGDDASGGGGGGALPPIAEADAAPALNKLVLRPGAFLGMPLLLCAGKGKRGAWTQAPYPVAVAEKGKPAPAPPPPPGAQQEFPGAVCPVTVTATEPSKLTVFTVAQFEAAAGPIAKVLGQALTGRQSILRPMGITDVVPARVPVQQLRFKISDFETIKFLGTGSFGRVTLVKFKDPKRQAKSLACRGVKSFALKQMVKQAVVDKRQLGHIKDERLLLYSLDHPFIVKLHGAFQDAACVYLLTEAVTAGEMFSIVYEGLSGHKEGQLPIEHGVFYAACVLEALAYMHGKGIAYRDLKPENLVLDDKGYVRIIDLGFAKKIPFEVDFGGKTEIHSKSFTMCGTPEYLAPEFIFNCGHDRGVDYWAFGVLVFELTAGHTPFQGPKDPNDMTSLFSRIAFCWRDGVNFPQDFVAKTKGRPTADLVTQLLQQEAKQRLGYLKTGADAMRAHGHFAGVDWPALLRKQTQAPWVPPPPRRKFNMANLKLTLKWNSSASVVPYTGRQDVFEDW